MCLMRRDEGNKPAAPPTDVTSGEQIEIDQTVSGSMSGSASRGRHGHQRKSSTQRAGGVKGPRSSKKSSSTSTSKSRTSSKSRAGTPKSSRGGGRSR